MCLSVSYKSWKALLLNLSAVMGGHCFRLKAPQGNGMAGIINYIFT